MHSEYSSVSIYGGQALTLPALEYALMSVCVCVCVLHLMKTHVQNAVSGWFIKDSFGQCVGEAKTVSTNNTTQRQDHVTNPDQHGGRKQTNGGVVYKIDQVWK